MDLTEAQWALIEPLIPKPRRRKDVAWTGTSATAAPARS